MNYNNKYPTFSFRIDHNLKVKLDKLAVIKKISTNEFARKIVSMYLKNELVEKTEDLQTEKVKLQIEKLKAEIKYMQIKNNYYETFNQPMSRIAERTIKPQIIVEQQKQIFQNPQSPYDASNKRLQCCDCGILFTWDSEKNFNEQLGEFQRHIVSKHDRIKTEIERQVLIDLKYEGDSR
jgi:hypothetical protein